MGCDLSDSDETAKIVKRVEAEEHANGMRARALPDAVPGTARDRRRRTGRAAALYQYAAAHSGDHASEGCDNCLRRRRASNDFELTEKGAYESAAICSRIH